MRTDDLCELAADLAAEHGVEAVTFARRTLASLELDGERERACFWNVLAVLLDDILAQRLDPERPIVVH